MRMTGEPFETPFKLFSEWFRKAEKTEPEFANAMTLATADKSGRPVARMVLLKDFDEKGFVFYTNLESAKARQLKENPKAALLFHWKSQKRQIRIEGEVELVSEREADAYFSTRPRGAQIGAWASDQSRAMKSRFELERRAARFTLQFRGKTVPRPPHWSGYRLVPVRFEFWQGRRFRLHERTLFTLGKGGTWKKEKLYP